MLTFEECKEVVEKVWGLDYPSDYYAWAHSSNTERDTAMTLYVNSWEGFGRTVEAMEEKGYCLSTNAYQCFGFYKNGRPVAGIDLGGCDFEWAERTHRAALEAVKEAE